MKAYVEERKEVVRVEGQSWPFQLDCRAGVLTVMLDGGPVRLRRYSWREKRALARFTHLGEAFLKNQVLWMSHLGEGSLPENEASREALWALACWLNGPQGNSGLPLDQSLLARVTFELCRAMGLSPAALDGLEAAEVEALWQAAGEEGRREEDPTSGARIVVVPDLESAGPASPSLSETQGRTEAEEKSPDAPRNPEPPRESDAAGPGWERAEATPSHAREVLSPKTVLRLQASRAGDPARAPDLAPSELGPVPGAKEQASSRQQRRFRVVPVTAPADLAGSAAVPRLSTRPEISPPADSDMLAGPASAAAGPAGAPKRPFAVRIQEPWAAAGGSSSAVVALEPVGKGPPAAPRMAALSSVQRESFPAEKPPEIELGRQVAAGEEWEDFLDEFAERLEAAAGAMGIDLES